MKVFITLVALALFSMLMLTSCEKEIITPWEEATVIDIAGVYDVRDACAKSEYPLTIRWAPEIDEGLVLENFMDLGIELRATIEGGRYEIPWQTYITDDLEEVAVTGSIFPLGPEEVALMFELRRGDTNLICGADCFRVVTK